jgi:single-stranded DNA-binding protein
MRGIHAAFVGRCRSDPELRKTGAGKPFLRFYAVVEDRDRDGKETSQSVSVAYFGEEAEERAAELRNGGSVYAEGGLRLASWTAADGTERHGLNLTAWRLEVLGKIGWRPREEWQEEARNGASAAPRRSDRAPRQPDLPSATSREDDAPEIEGGEEMIEMPF